jgi:hypothetical protein
MWPPLECLDDEPDGGLISQANTGIAAIDPHVEICS